MLKAVVRNTVHFILSPVERSLVGSSGQGSLPVPVFILGAPRSGTTLLYELLVTRYEFSYVTNLANTFYQTPLAVSKLGDFFKRSWHGRQTSSFGAVKGAGAPSEAGALWGRWVPEFGYLDERDTDTRRTLLDESARTIKALQKIHHAPFLNKNVMHSVHVRFLDVVFPGCLFIDLRREAKANVRSIVRARQKHGGPVLDSDGWWSVRPRNVETWCGLSLEEQACAQVMMLRRDIDASFAKIGEGRRIMINYEDVCANPEVALENIAALIEPSCGTLKRRSDFSEAITLSQSKPFDSISESVIDRTLASLR